MQRDAKGRFLTKGRPGRSHKRRGNPAESLVPVMLANPRRIGPRKRRAAGRVVVINDPDPAGNPRRRRRGYRRRSLNPGGVSLLKLAAAGGGGILLARAGRYWLGKVVPSGMTGEILKVVGQGAIAYALHRFAPAIGLSHDVAGALAVGAGAETARSVVGLIVSQVAPDFQRDQVGLGAAPFAIDDHGAIYQLDQAAGEYRLLPPAQQMAGLEDVEQFGSVETDEAWQE